MQKFRRFTRVVRLGGGVVNLIGQGGTWTDHMTNITYHLP